MMEILDVDKKAVIDVISWRNRYSDHGKSTIFVMCPFCKKETVAYMWSISGSGKKCNFCTNTLLTMGTAFKRHKTENEAKMYLSEAKKAK